MDAAVAIIEVPLPDRCILLIRRAEREGDPWSGHWALPGGRCEAGDLDPLATCLREVHEEIGMVLPTAACTATLPPAIAGSAVGRRLHVAPFCFRIAEMPPLSIAAAEVAAVYWLPLAWLRERQRHRLGAILPGRSEIFPHLLVDGHPLWGFTYRVLCGYAGVSLEGFPT